MEVPRLPVEAVPHRLLFAPSLLALFATRPSHRAPAVPTVRGVALGA